MDLRVTSCITNYIYGDLKKIEIKLKHFLGNPVEKGCGPCKYPVERKDGEKYSCTECKSDKCNSVKISRLSILTIFTISYNFPFRNQLPFR